MLLPSFVFFRSLHTSQLINIFGYFERSLNTFRDAFVLFLFDVANSPIFAYFKQNFRTFAFQNMPLWSGFSDCNELI